MHRLLAFLAKLGCRLAGHLLPFCELARSGATKTSEHGKNVLIWLWRRLETRPSGPAGIGAGSCRAKSRRISEANRTPAAVHFSGKKSRVFHRDIRSGNEQGITDHVKATEMERANGS